MKNRVVHFEIPSANPEQTMKFFNEVFGWTFQQFGPQDYWIATTGKDGTPGINGSVMKRRDPNQPLVNSILVENIDQCMAQITKAGGQIVVPKMSIPTVGWLAYFKDLDGVIHGIWQEDNSAQ